MVAFFRCRLRLGGEVVDGLAVDGGGPERGRHPLTDVTGATEAAATAPALDVVLDLAVGDVLLELLEGRRRVRAAEAADPDDGLAAGQFQTRRLLRTVRGGRPLGLGTREQLPDRAARALVAEAATESTAAEAARSRAGRGDGT